MPLNTEQDDQLKKWMIAQNQDSPFGDNPPLSPNVPGGTSVQSPTPSIAPTPETPDSSVRDSRIQDSHPGNKPEDFSKESQSNIASLDQYGPEQEKAVYESIANDSGSLGNRLSRAGAGLGDSLMAIGGANGPGFLKSLEDRKKIEEDRALNKIPTLGKMNTEKIGAKQSLEEKDPSSALSRAAQTAYDGIFQRIGFPAGSTKNKSAQELRTIASLGAEVHGKEFENAVKAAELKINAQRVQNEEVRQQTTAAEDTTKSYNPVKSFFGIGPSKKEAQNAQQVLIKNAGATEKEPDSVKIRDSQGQLHMIPYKNLGKAKQRDPKLEVIQ